MRFCLLWALIATMAIGLPAPAATPSAEVDRLLQQENAASKVKEAPLVDDLAFLRRVSVDLNGRIPTEAEIKEFLALPAGTRRAQWVEKLLKRDQFADRWTVFFGDMLRIRSGSEGGAEFLAMVHRGLDKGLPYDALCRQLLSASGKAGLTPEVGFILGDGADPMAMAGVTAQVFLGVRIACAQCHNHPFDVWKRKEFYDLAAYFGKTRRVEHRIKDRRLGVSLSETSETVILWPPEDKANGKPRTAVKARFPFPLDASDGPSKHIARLKELRDRQEAEALAARKGNGVDDLLNEADKKLDPRASKDPLDVASEAKIDARNLQVEKDIYKASQLRAELGKLVTDPRNRQFSRNLVNRVWGELLGRGFVNPVDDFREDNPASHARTLDYLADEFVANGYDVRWLVRTIVNTQAYQRSHLPMSVDPVARRASQSAFASATVRRMISEAMYDSMVQAGHLFAVKHRPGENLVKIQTTVREMVPDKGSLASLDPKKMKKPVVMAAPMMQGGGYDLERSIEVNFLDVLKKRGEGLNVESMRAMSKEEIEAQQMQMEAKPGKKVKYITRTIETTVDDNPRFTSSMRMASPAPVGHFLRVFGQTDRSTLDERRDHTPSMRQALMMLNGKLTNEAARVGALEPIYPLLAGDKPDLNNAIGLAYREILTREPTAEELTEAKQILGGASTPLEGMADLRWALFNSHEFRFLP